ncbi:hypothetical protein PtA15_18A386 [Puccinia triticina]|uniref:Altered inheritance of mitochondria protein 41 n=1 Tax=Puccinia triticina TaxID=208348 RepID=A0ABY7DAE1_9BASI|nr:uncharacterized protein PtA15_18A386 [Puccinia triticina]WAQ93326.1 hypothetical protein PtA15_18A386 [Puccinia triticina]
MKQTIFYALSALQLLSQTSCTPLTTSKLPTRSNDVLLFSRDVRSHLRYRRSPLPQAAREQRQELKLENSVPNVRQVDAKNTKSDVAVQEAAKTLTLATRKVEDIIMVLQNPQASEADIRKAAQEALRIEASEDFHRETLASASQNSTGAQEALAIIRDQGPRVIAGFQEIEKNARDKRKVVESLKQIMLVRLQVVAANNELIGGIRGGDRQLVLKAQISPSQLAVGGKLDGEQKKAVEEAQRNLAAQTKKVDEAVAVIQKRGSTPQEIEAAAREALVQEANEDFARIVLASAAIKRDEAMEALAAVIEHGPTEVVAGFKAIAEDSSNAASVKKNIDLVVKGREKVVPANLKLIELSGGLTSPTIGAQPVRQADKKLVASVAGGQQVPPTIDTLSVAGTADETIRKERKDGKAGRADRLTLADESAAKAERGQGTTTRPAAGEDELEVTRRLLSRLSGGAEQSVVRVGSAAAKAAAPSGTVAPTPEKKP